MEKFRRIFVVVMDSLGVGEAEDAAQFGDVGSNTLGHISQSDRKSTRLNSSHP